jgi:hypothetical protein
MPRSAHSLAFRAVSTVAFSLLAACSNATSDGPSAPLGLAGGQTIVLANPDDAVWPADPLTVRSARIAGDTLIAAVEHGGGCREHDYRVIVSTIWMESFPIQVPARISHDAHGDVCKALLTREVRVSLAPLANAYRDAYRQEHGSIALRLAGSPSELLFSF